jgi:uncharacterized protein (TIGR01777 family)
VKFAIPGGSGQVGQVLTRSLEAKGHEVVVIGRGGDWTPSFARWDGRTQGEWVEVVDGSDVVINLAGRSVNCRYTEENLTRMMDSRVDSTRAVGQAIAEASEPPALWMQMSTATIYAHRLDAPNDEATGLIGGDEEGVPAYWRRSIEIAQAWERATEDFATPHTRKVLLRSAMVMSPDAGGIFDVLASMVARRLGGPIAGGGQFVSWIHDLDFVRAIEFIIADEELDGPVNLAAPEPLPQREFMRSLREAAGVRLGLPATRWMAERGAMVIGSDTELLLKSRRVVPGRLSTAGFEFRFDRWEDAARDLVARRHARDG